MSTSVQPPYSAAQEDHSVKRRAESFRLMLILMIVRRAGHLLLLMLQFFDLVAVNRFTQFSLPIVAGILLIPSTILALR